MKRLVDVAPYAVEAVRHLRDQEQAKEAELFEDENGKRVPCAAYDGNPENAKQSHRCRTPALCSVSNVFHPIIKGV